jgi:hypothetical protein
MRAPGTAEELTRLCVALRVAIARNSPESYFIGEHQCNIAPESDKSDEIQLDGGFNLRAVIIEFLEALDEFA